jgi:hypothetical protein
MKNVTEAKNYGTFSDNREQQATENSVDYVKSLVKYGLNQVFSGPVDLLAHDENATLFECMPLIIKK